MLESLSSALAALLTGVAVALLITSPAQQVRRVTAGAGRTAGDGRAAVVDRLPMARSDAVPLGRRVTVAFAAAIAVGGALWALGGVLALAAWAVVPLLATIGVLVLGRLEPARSRRRRERLAVELPQALELLSACLAAGMPLRQATAAVGHSFDGPVGEDLGQVVSLVNLGLGDVEAWSTLRSSPQWRATVVDLARSVDAGTRLVEVLLHHARDARNLRRTAIEVRAKGVGVRSVLPLMVCFLPAFLLVGVVPTVASSLIHALP